MLTDLMARYWDALVVAVAVSIGTIVLGTIWRWASAWIGRQLKRAYQWLSHIHPWVGQLVVAIAVGIVVFVIATQSRELEILVGAVGIHQSKTPNLWNVLPTHCPEGADGKRGELNGRVDFDKPFSSPPVVLMGFSGLDIAHEANVRISAKVKKVDRDGFDYALVTWCNTRVWWTRVNWIAISKSVGGTLEREDLFRMFGGST